jgi:hypothetical protein
MKGESLMMTIEEKRGIARRALMRGMGVTMGLPLVDAITPGTHLAASAQKASIVKRTPESVMVQQRIPDSIIEGFRKLQDDLASICDVLVGLGLNNCVYSGVKPLDPKSRICGPARTLRLILSRIPRVRQERFGRNSIRAR